MTAALGALENVLWGVITFSILVVMHEGGHFLAARAFGVKVHEFMLGLPGPALRYRTDAMDWGITAIPLGGYVRIAGMEPGAEDPLVGETLVAVRDNGTSEPHALARELGVDEERAQSLLLTVEDWKAVSRDEAGRLSLTVDGDVAAMSAAELADTARAVTYRGQTTPRRIAILSAGVLTNLVAAILTFTVFLTIWGYYDVTTRVDTVETGTPAAAAGIRDGDTLVALDGEPIEQWTEFQALMGITRPGDSVVLTMDRNGAEMDFRLELAAREGHGYAGIGPTPVKVEPNVFQSLGKSVELTAMTFKTVLGLFDPSQFSATVAQFTSVVGVSVRAAEAAKAGPIDYAYLIAALSLSLGIVNILPLPPLDGGKIVLEIVERVVGRPIGRNVSLALSAIGALLLFSLIGYLTYLDITRLGG
jgi:regulator of sigma E protease